jgi:hypothetical protein
VMQTVGQTASLTGTTIMLSVVRLVGPEDAERSYQPVWALCAGLGLVTFLTACTLSGTDAAAGTPRAAAASSAGKGEGGEDDEEEGEETDSLLGGGGDSDDNDGGYDKDKGRGGAHGKGKELSAQKRK